MVDKTSDKRLRRMAHREGYVLQKSARRDRTAQDYGLYRLFEKHIDTVDHRAATPFSLTIQQVEAQLTSNEDDFPV